MKNIFLAFIKNCKTMLNLVQIYTGKYRFPFCKYKPVSNICLLNQKAENKHKYKVTTKNPLKQLQNFDQNYHARL